jgi:hypothetical protein
VTHRKSLTSPWAGLEVRDCHVWSVPHGGGALSLGELTGEVCVCVCEWGGVDSGTVHLFLEAHHDNMSLIGPI